MLDFKTQTVKLANGGQAEYVATIGEHKVFNIPNIGDVILKDGGRFYEVKDDQPFGPISSEYQPVQVAIFHKGSEETLTVDEWEEYFQPVSEGEDEGDRMFLGLKEAVGYIEEELGIKEDMYRYLWTAVDGGSDLYVIMNGRRVCNSLHYVVCTFPWGTSDKEVNGSVYIEVGDEDV